jgi:hypothetical protein
MGKGKLPCRVPLNEPCEPPCAQHFIECAGPSNTLNLEYTILNMSGQRVM